MMKADGGVRSRSPLYFRGGKHMKRVFCLLLALCLVLTVAACGKSKESDKSKNTNSDSANEPVPNPGGREFDVAYPAPDNYAFAVNISINPQFVIYLDENGVCLSVTPSNSDAMRVVEGIKAEGKTLDAVLTEIIEKTNQRGYLSKEKSIYVKVSGTKSDKEAEVALMGNVKQSIENTLLNLGIGDVTVAESESDEPETLPPDEPENLPADNPTGGEGKQEPKHTHSFGAATCTLPAKCSCGAVSGTALGHEYKDGICLRCGEKDPNFKPTALSLKTGYWEGHFQNSENTVYTQFTLGGSKEKGVSVLIGVPVSTLRDYEEHKEQYDKLCRVLDGVNYYFGAGDGTETEVYESGNTVTVTDPNGNSLTFERTGENTLKCISLKGEMLETPGWSVGLVLTFVAE